MTKTLQTAGISRVAGVGLLLALVASPLWAAAPDHGGPRGEWSGERAGHMAAFREMKDRAEIDDLMWRYVRALDTLNADAYAAVYTDDGQFVSGANAVKGRDALKGMIADLKKRRADREAQGQPKTPGTLHLITNHNLVFTDPDHATYYSYWMTCFPAQGQETPARVAAVGHGVDQLVRVDGHWLIKYRDVAPKD